MEYKWVFGCNQIEDIIQYLLICPLYKNPRERFLLFIIQMYPNCVPKEIVSRLLTDNQLLTISTICVGSQEAEARTSQEPKCHPV